LFWYQVFQINNKILWSMGDNIFQHTNNYENVLMIFDEIKSNLNNEPSFLLTYGKVLLLNGQAVEAVEVLQQALSITSDPFLYSNLGEGYEKLGDMGQAEFCYKRSVNMVPNRFYSRYVLTNFYFSNQEYLKARETAEDSLNVKVKIPSVQVLQLRSRLKHLLNALELGQDDKSFKH